MVQDKNNIKMEDVQANNKESQGCDVVWYI